MGQRVKSAPPPAKDRAAVTSTHTGGASEYQGHDAGLGHHDARRTGIAAPRRYIGVVSVSMLPPPPVGAPHTFRDTNAGRAWQERHFARVLDLVGPHPEAASIGRARAYLASHAAGVPPVEVEAFVQEVAWGAQARQEALTRLVSAPPLARAPLHDHQASLAVLLVSQLEATLVPLHETLQQCLVASFRQRVSH
jgi:hypothetical protein